MPITVQELWDSREHQIGEDASIDLRFVVSGTDDDVAAHLELLNVALPGRDPLRNKARLFSRFWIDATCCWFVSSSFSRTR